MITFHSKFITAVQAILINGEFEEYAMRYVFLSPLGGKNYLQKK